MKNANIQTIQRIQLNDSHIGSKVTYIPSHANGDASHKDCESGTIMSWNHRGIFVDYVRNKCLTRACDLVWG